MSQFPRTENDILALASAMFDGLMAHAVDFPNVDPVVLGAKVAAYNTVRTAQLDAAAAAKIATEAKNTELTELEELMRSDLKQAEVNTAGAGQASNTVAVVL